MRIKANNNFAGALDLSSMERLSEENPIERLPFRLSIRPGQIITVDDKWYTLQNIQSSLRLGYIQILDYELVVKVDPPTSPTSDGIQGAWAFDGIYFYHCVATNTWVRNASVTSW
jgi:hypothetical protein